MIATIGFIGLGAMGGDMAANLVRAGASMIVHDIDETKVSALVKLGAGSAAAPAEIGQKADRTITMVETTAQTEVILFGASGLTQTATAGHAVAMMSKTSAAIG